MIRWFKRLELKLKNSHVFAFRKSAKRVFYPGCSLPGADPEFCLKVYSTLKKKDPELGIWFDCCAKPQRMKNDHQSAEKEEQSLLQKMQAAGVEEVITACGNCFVQFENFAAGQLKLSMVYDVLEDLELTSGSTDWTIHHPCFARSQPQLQQGVFRLADRQGIEIKNRDQQDHPLHCCLHTGKNTLKRRAALKQEKLLTYCAHCVMSFQSDIPARHLLQELLGSSAQWTSPGKLGLFANYRRFCLALRREVLKDGAS